MESKVVDNALDFIVRAADDLWDERLSPEQQVKYSTIELYEGIELLLKARLMQDHWSLVIRDISKYKKDSFSKGDFVSVNYESGVERLSTVCQIEIDPRATKSFDKLRRLRNRYVHFSCEEPRNTVLSIQVHAWHYVLELLRGPFITLNRQQKAQLEAAREKMLKSEEFLSARYDGLKPQIDAKKAEGHLFVMCTVCGNESMELGDGFPSCDVCGIFEADPMDCANEYAIEHNPFWMHPRRGTDDDVAWCECCGNQAVVPAGEELAHELEAQLSHIPREPGEDREVYLCFACGEATLSRWIKTGPYCGAKYSNSDPRGGCPACRHGIYGPMPGCDL